MFFRWTSTWGVSESRISTFTLKIERKRFLELFCEYVSCTRLGKNTTNYETLQISLCSNVTNKDTLTNEDVKWNDLHYGLQCQCFVAVRISSGLRSFMLFVVYQEHWKEKIKSVCVCSRHSSVGVTCVSEWRVSHLEEWHEPASGRHTAWLWEHDVDQGEAELHLQGRWYTRTLIYFHFPTSWCSMTDFCGVCMCACGWMDGQRTVLSWWRWITTMSWWTQSALTSRVS